MIPLCVSTLCSKRQKSSNKTCFCLHENPAFAGFFAFSLQCVNLSGKSNTPDLAGFRNENSVKPESLGVQKPSAAGMRQPGPHGWVYAVFLNAQ